MGLVAAYLVFSRPSGLAVPPWVALTACDVFILSGITLILPAERSPALRRCLVVLWLAAMAALPAWLAFGTGPWSCATTVPFFDGERSSRVVFGLSSGLTLTMLGSALVPALRHAKVR